MKLETELLEITKDNLAEAQFMASNFIDKTVQNRIFFNVAGSEAIISYLEKFETDVSNVASIHSIKRVIEKIDIADVILDNIHIDVRVIFNENEIFIPKSHFALGIVPDIYAVLKYDKSFQRINFIGFFEASAINLNYHNDEYYFIEPDKLQSPFDMLDFIKNFKGKTDKKLTESQILKGRELSIAVADHDVTSEEFNEFLGLLVKSSELRRSVLEYDNFETLASKVAFALQVSKSKRGGQIETIDMNDFMNMQDDTSENDEHDNLASNSKNIEDEDLNGDSLLDEDSDVSAEISNAAAGAATGAVIAGAVAGGLSAQAVSNEAIELAAVAGDVADVAADVVSASDDISLEPEDDLSSEIGNIDSDVSDFTSEPEENLSEGLPDESVETENIQTDEMQQDAEPEATESDDILSAEGEGDLFSSEDEIPDIFDEDLSDFPDLTLSEEEAVDENTIDVEQTPDKESDTDLNVFGAETAESENISQSIHEDTDELPNVESEIPSESEISDFITEAPNDGENQELEINDSDMQSDEFDIEALDDFITEEPSDSTDNDEADASVSDSELQDFDSQEMQDEMSTSVDEISVNPSDILEDSTSEDLIIDAPQDEQLSDIDLITDSPEQLNISDELRDDFAEDLEIEGDLDDITDGELGANDDLIENSEVDDATTEEVTSVDDISLEASSEEFDGDDNIILKDNEEHSSIENNNEIDAYTPDSDSIPDDIPEENSDSITLSSSIENAEASANTHDLNELPTEYFEENSENSDYGLVNFSDLKDAHTVSPENEEVSFVDMDDFVNFETVTPFEQNSEVDYSDDAETLSAFEDTNSVKENSFIISDKNHNPGEIFIDINKDPSKVDISIENEHLEELYNKDSILPDDSGLNNDVRVVGDNKGKSIPLAVGVGGLALLIFFAGLIIFFVSKSMNPSQEEDGSLVMNNNTEQNNNNLGNDVPDVKPDNGDIVMNNEQKQSSVPQSAGLNSQTDTSRAELPKATVTQPNRPIPATSFLSVKKLSWEVPDYVSADASFRQYFQSAGKSLKAGLSSDLLLATDYTYSDQMRLSILYSNDGSFQRARVLLSSGSTQVDDIVLQSVNQTLKVLKAPNSLGNDQSTTVILKIYL